MKKGQTMRLPNGSLTGLTASQKKEVSKTIKTKSIYELRQIAKSNDMKGYSRKKKTELMKHILVNARDKKMDIVDILNENPEPEDEIFKGKSEYLFIDEPKEKQTGYPEAKKYPALYSIENVHYKGGAEDYFDLTSHYSGTVLMEYTFKYDGKKFTRTPTKIIVYKKLTQIFDALVEYINRDFVLPIPGYDKKWRIIGFNPSVKGQKFGDQPIKTLNIIHPPYKVEFRKYTTGNCYKQDILATMLNRRQRIINKHIGDINQHFTVDQILEFVKTCKINHRYMNIYATKFYEEIHDQNLPIHYGILGNEHFYGLDKKAFYAIKTHKKDSLEIENIEYVPITKIEDKLREARLSYIIEHQIATIYEKKLTIKSFVSNKTLYHTDQATVDIYNLSTSLLGYKLPIKQNASIDDILNHVLQINNLESTFYDNIFDTVDPIMYSNPAVGDEDIYVIDKNRAYTSEIDQFKYLPKIDASTPIRAIEKDHEFDIYNMYHLSKIDNIYNIIRKEWCFGFAIKNMLQHVTYDLYIKPILIENPLADILAKIHKYRPDLVKEFNKTIGRWQVRQTSYTCYPKIYSTPFDLANLPDDTIVQQIANDIYVEAKTKEIKDKYKPSFNILAHLVVDSLKNRVIEKIIELKTLYPTMMVRQINVDGVAIQQKNIDLSKISLDPTDFKGWKLSKFIPSPHYINAVKQPTITNKYRAFVHNNTVDLSYNMFFCCYAGTGKTYYVINEIIPKLINKKVIIVAGTHSALTEYKNSNVHYKVIQYFRSKDRLRELKQYDYIIVEEAGLLTSQDWNLIYKNLTKDQILIALGDPYQLPPVDEAIKNKEDPYQPLENLNLMTLFDKIIKLTTNRRNTYSIKNDYDRMINDTYILTDFERSKISTELNPLYKEYNICYCNKTKEKVNKYMTQTWTDEFANLKVKANGRLVSTKNVHELDIYNRMFFTIKEYSETITLIDTLDNEYVLSESQFKSCGFEHGYALTLYQAQGKSILAKDISFWDWEMIKSVKGGVYTALSRIKTL